MLEERVALDLAHRVLAIKLGHGEKLAAVGVLEVVNDVVQVSRQFDACLWPR